MPDATNNRRYFRLQYPAKMIPAATINGVSYDIPEISEGGLRIRCTRFGEFRIGQEVEGTISLDEDHEIAITGVIYRRDADDYVIAPLDGVSFKLVMQEQRKILKQFTSVAVDSDGPSPRS